MAYTQNHMHKPSEEGFPAALRALIVLQKEAARTTPQGAPTITDKLMQGIAQPSGGAPAPTPADGAPAPTMQDMVNNAGIAGGVEAQQQAAQQQQMAQMAAQAGGQPPDQSAPQAPPDAQPPQMMAEGGIASLPVDMHEFAEGGILGFAGGGSSDIGYTDPMGMLTGMPEPESTYVPTASEKQASEIRAALGPISNDVQFDYREGSDPADMARQLQTAVRFEKDPAKQAQLKTEIDRLLKSIPPRAPVATPPSGDGYGLNFGDSGGIARPSPEDALALAEKFAGPQPDRSKIEALEAQRRQVAEEEPAIDTESARKAYEKDKADDEFRRFITLNEAERHGLGGSGPAYIQFQKSIAERDAAYNSFQENAKHAMWERRRGNVKDALAFEEQANKDMLEYNKLRGQVGANVYGTEGGIYSAELGRQGQREAALSRIAAAQIRAKKGIATAAPTYAEQKILAEMVNQHFSSPAAITKSPEARALITRMPGGKQLLLDLQNGNKTPEQFMAEPVVEQARKMFKRTLEEGSKYGHPGAVPDIASAMAQEDALDETD